MQAKTLLGIASNAAIGIHPAGMQGIWLPCYVVTHCNDIITPEDFCNNINKTAEGVLTCSTEVIQCIVSWPMIH